MRIVAAILAVCMMAQAQEAGRKIVSNVAAAYPPVARTMNITGMVKVEAVVSSDGAVKSVEILGGHPLLAQSAVAAVYRWRWATASHETKETIQLNFIPS